MRGKFAANDSPRRDSRDPGLQCSVAVDADTGTAIQYNVVRRYSTVSLPNILPVG
jgi:hypothetical protein